jgi:hypothetical protein
MKSKLDVKNNFKLLGSIVLIVFLLFIFFNEKRRARNHANIKKRGQKTIAVTVGCDKNIRSSMHTLHYKFTYKDNTYFGSKDFDIDKRGNICNDVNFLVLFDPMNPDNSEILLDSILNKENQQ